MTVNANVVILSSEDVKKAKLTSYRLSELALALEMAGYELCVAE